jgi:PmbA protein
MGQKILSAAVTVIDDPLRPRGHASRPFDAEGLPARQRTLVDQGVLASWVLDLRSARQLGLKPTGQAARGLSSPPGPSTSNLYIQASDVSPEQLRHDIGRGLLVTELIGMGVNLVTGDYSRGASGFWIENGEIAYPVSEITIAGNLKDMFLAITPANDLEFRGATNAPSLAVEGVTIAGR